MANLNRTQSRIVPQHKTEAEWLAWLQETGNEDFCPKPGEIIIFDPDDNYNYSRFKVGRQKFTTDENGNIIEDGYYKLSELEFSSGAANGKGQNSLQVGKVGDYATEALGDYSIAIGYNKGNVPTQSVGIASAAIGRGIQTYGRMSLGIGADSFTGLTEEEKERARTAVGFTWNSTTKEYSFSKDSEPYFTDNGDGTYNLHPRTSDSTFPSISITRTHSGATSKTFSISPYYNGNLTKEDLKAGDIFYNFGNNVLVAGWASDAIGESSYIFGNSNIALGKNSFITGTDSKIYSYGNVSLGHQNEIGDSENTDFGHRTQEAQNIIAIGIGLKSKTANQIVLGKYNEKDTEATILIGNGNDSNNLHNAISVYKDKIKIFPSATKIDKINEPVFEKESDYYGNHSNSLVIKFSNTKPYNWDKIEKSNYYFYFSDGEYYKGQINEIWNGTFNLNVENLYAFRIKANENISYTKMEDLTFLKIYSFQEDNPEVEISSNGNILIPQSIQKDATPNRLVTYQELQNVKNGLLGNPEKLSTSYDTISEIADILSNQSGETTTGGLIENVAFLMRGVGSETNDKYANDNAKAPTLSCKFEIGNDIDNDIIGVTLPAGKLNCTASIQEVAEDLNIVSNVTEAIQNTNISASSNFPWLKSDYSWDGTQITESGYYYISFTAEQANTFNFKYYADENSKTKTITKSSSKKPLNFTVYKGTYYGISASEITDIELNNFTLAYENSMSKKDYDFTCNNEYIYFLEPKGGANLIFEKDGFVGGFNAPVEKTFTNKYGISQEYKVYRSTNKQNGTLIIKVK